MIVQKRIWDRFVNHNNFDLYPITRHPMTGNLPEPGEGILNLLEGTITLTTPEDYTEVPDDWFLPLTKKGLPPKGKQRIERYMFSEKGWEAVKDQMRAGYCYPKCSFDEFADCITHNIKHYRKTQKRRAKNTKTKREPNPRFNSPLAVAPELEETFSKLRDSGFIKAIIHYKDGSFWFWCHDHAFDGCGRTHPDLLDLYNDIYRISMRGHDTDAATFNRRCGAKGAKIEMVGVV